MYTHEYRLFQFRILLSGPDHCYHLEPQPSAIIQRAKFYSCSRERGETVAQYLSKVQAIARQKVQALLNFGDKLDDNAMRQTGEQH